jgi:pyruvate,water dikinase
VVDVLSPDAVVWLDDHPRCDVRRVGGKAAHLSHLMTLQAVPPGFCIAADTYTRYTARDHLPPPLAARVVEAYAQLAQRCGEDEPSVAVRSSAVDEDGEAASFAGQHETYLNIRGAAAVIAAVERCWESATTERVLAYRREHGFNGGGPRLAVLVQQLVASDVSAVVFSAHPVTGRRDQVVATASWGLGESIVGGTVTPDTWVVDRNTHEVVEHQLGDKQRMTIAVEGGTREVDVPRLLRRQASLTAAQLRELVDLALRLECAAGWPIDAECAFAGNQLYLLQCRPITTLAPAQDA